MSQNDLRSSLMSLKLPDYSDPFLTGMHLCAFDGNPDFAKRLGVPDRIDIDAKYGNGHWIRLLIHPKVGLKDDETHFHINLIRSFDSGKSPASSTAAEIESKILSVAGMKIKAWIRGKYSIPKDKYPKKGIVPALNFSTEISGETLTLTGAKLSFKGQPFDEIEWSTARDGSLTVELDAFSDIEVSEKFLLDAESILKSGIDRFVILKEKQQ